ncbi:SLC13 family permease [Nitrincola alkalilacustris]|uniref:SLC13 family permease n=1 Tax=Nitrincola alkalilacustris TaxID=1571224 RepID=UPI00124C6AB9|nr:SLC13 family permease [Nitrincola alkalilacustris]
MDWQALLCATLVIGALATLIFTRIGPHLVMTAVLIILSVTGILNPAEALSGFSNPGLITVAAMFVVAAGIHHSGGIDIVVKYLLGKPDSVRKAQFRLSLPVLLLSGFLNNTPVVATMIPAVISWSKKIRVPVNLLLMPLSYAAILGGTLTLIGTSTNLIVNGQFQSLSGHEGLSLFSITSVGLTVAVVGLLFMLWWIPKALPQREKEQPFSNLREFTLEVAIAYGGPLVGKTVAEAGLRDLERVYLVEIERDGNIVTAVPSQERLKGGDRLVFAGDTEAIIDLLRIHGIVASTDDSTPTLAKDKAERCLVEAVVSGHCDCIGQTIRDSRFRDRYGAVVLAVARGARRIKGNLGSIRLQAGDTLLLEARPAFVTRQRHAHDFLLINDLEAQTPRHQKAWIAWGILAGLVALASFGITSMLNAALLGAAAMLLTGCCSSGDMQKSLDLTVLITIAASFAMGVALYKTGLASFLAEHMVSVSNGNLLLMLLLTCLAVSLLTEMITNNAAAILMLPITLEMTNAAGFAPEPFVIAIMMGASASFASPLGYQTNLMVYGPGGYHFTDFLKVGLPMNLVTGLTTVGAIWFFWL